MADQRRAVDARARCCGRSATHDTLLPDHARAPRRRRRRLARRDAAGAGRARQGRGRVPGRATSSRCPYEYRFIELDGLVTEPPADLAERTLVFLDCGNIDRTPPAR